MGTLVTIEADGADEDAAIQTLESAFTADENDLTLSENTPTDQRE